jgi:hypothetical protein
LGQDLYGNGPFGFVLGAKDLVISGSEVCDTVIQWQVCEITHITVRNDRVSLGGQTFGGARDAILS